MKATIKVTAKTERGRRVLAILRREQGGVVGVAAKFIGARLDARPVDAGDVHSETVDLKDLPGEALNARLVMLEKDFFERMRFYRANRRDFIYEVDV